MAYTIPNLESSPPFDAQAIPDSTDFQCLTSWMSGLQVASDLIVAPQSSPNMTVQISSGVVFGISTQISATSSLSIASASSTDRKDLIFYTFGTGILVTAGTPCGTAGWTRNSSGFPPIKPALPSISIPIAEIYVANTTTAITSDNIRSLTMLTLPFSNLIERSGLGTPVTSYPSVYASTQDHSLWHISSLYSVPLTTPAFLTLWNNFK